MNVKKIKNPITFVENFATDYEVVSGENEICNECERNLRRNEKVIKNQFSGESFCKKCAYFVLDDDMRCAREEEESG